MVEKRIEDGQELIHQLVRDDFDVEVAFWLKTSEEDWWHLYVASKVVDERGPLEAYRAVQGSLGRLTGTTISLSDVKLIGTEDPIATQMLKLQERNRAKKPISYQAVGGGMGAEEAYIYPPLPARRVPSEGEERRLKKSVRQIIRPEDYRFTKEEKAAVNKLMDEGVTKEEAERWVIKKRGPQSPRPRIPAGTIVRARIAVYWGDKPDDDPNPLLIVEAPDGARGLIFKENTEPV